MIKRFIERYERYYPHFAIAVVVGALSLAFAFSPLGEKAKARVDDMFAKDEATGVRLVGKLKNDWGIRPERFLHRDHAPSLDDFEPVEGAFAARRSARPLVRSRDRDRDDAFVIVGAFEFEEGLHGAILIDRRGRLLHRWLIPPLAGRSGVMREDYRVFPHGFALARDGTAVIAFDNGGRIIRIDPCGRLLWRRDGAYNHSVTVDPEHPDEVWTIAWDSAARLRASDGKELESVRMRLIEQANPGLDLFGVRQRDRFDRSTSQSDPVHFNDVEPLPAALAPAFPRFAAGDMLVSARSPNLVFVVDRKTRKVKWHATGYWRRQHDADWGSDGRIYVFNNNMNRGPSSIVAIDPTTMEAQTVVDGERLNFYSNIRGKQQRTADGRIAIAVSQQGRAIEVDENGEISFEFLNRYDAKTGQSLVVSEIFRVDRASLDFDALKACSR